VRYACQLEEVLPSATERGAPGGDSVELVMFSSPGQSHRSVA